MFFKSSFTNRNIRKVNTTTKAVNIKNIFRETLRFLIIASIFGFTIIFWNSIAYSIGGYVKNVAWVIAKKLAQFSAKQPKKDYLGNINILLLGIGGKNHDGGYLTDTIMIASFNPKLKTLTFLSIPRDLYVKYDKYRGGRINYIFAQEYLKTHNYDKAAAKLGKKIQQITGIGINYYLVVDFGGFERFIDSLGGITINVPYTLVDYRYPGPNRTYTIFKITKGIHHLDGATALKYARSRHSTSDFSRSARQEQIIKAILHKILSTNVLLSPIKFKNLYLKFQDTFKTNMDFGVILSFIPYAQDLKIHSYVLNGDCFYKNVTWKNLIPGCFVYPAPRDLFNGQAVLLPVDATPSNVEVYDKIKKFAFIALGYPELWLENSQIQILNGINKQQVRKYYGYLKPLASKLAYKLKNYGFNVVDVGNASKVFEKNIGYIYNKKEITQQLLQTFVPGGITYKTGDVHYAGSGYDMTLILGNDYLYNQ